MNLNKLTKIAAIIIAVIGIFFLGALMASGAEPAKNSWITPLIFLSYIVFALCVLIVLVYVLKNLFSSKENLRNTLIAVGLFLAVIIISYILADGSDVKAGGLVYSGTTPKLVGTGIVSFYILGIVAIGTMVWSTISNFKK